LKGRLVEMLEEQINGLLYKIDEEGKEEEEM